MTVKTKKKPIVKKIVFKTGRNAYAYLSDGSVVDVWYRPDDKKYIVDSFLPNLQIPLDEIANITCMTSIR